jgi:hypothetical protein
MLTWVVVGGFEPTSVIVGAAPKAPETDADSVAAEPIGTGEAAADGAVDGAVDEGAEDDPADDLAFELQPTARMAIAVSAATRRMGGKRRTT